MHAFFRFWSPSNLFAVTSLRQLADNGRAVLNDTEWPRRRALWRMRWRRTSQIRDRGTAAGSIWAYEVDGYGGHMLMDDANVPSLLGLPYLASSPDSALYARTRSFVWSERNPWFFKGKAGEGIGGPHIGRDMIWPMSQIIFALTSNSDIEIVRTIRMLQRSSANTGYMHESYHKDDPTRFTRAWFAWANTLFGELIGKIVQTNPQLLKIYHATP